MGKMRCFSGIVGLIVASGFGVWAQAPRPAIPPSAPPPQRVGGFVPGQQRTAEDPELVKQGKGIYGISCRGCHGADLRGGDMGGPNLLRSMLSLTDREGEKIVPIILNGVPNGMPPIPMKEADAKAVASFVRSVLGTIGGQGKPPSELAPPSILVGNAEAGKVFFDSKCASCHSATGDLKGIATKISDPKILQNTWVAGARGGRGGARSTAKPITVAVTPPGGNTVEGRLIRIDDFVVTLEMPDGSSRSFGREGDSPQVVVNDPLAGHRALLPVYADKDMHNVTAYLVTLQ